MTRSTTKNLKRGNSNSTSAACSQNFPSSGCKNCMDEYEAWFAATAKQAFADAPCIMLEWRMDYLIDDGFPFPLQTFKELRKQLKMKIPTTSAVMGTMFIESVSYYARYISTVRLVVSNLNSPELSFPKGPGYGFLYEPKPFDFSPAAFAKLFRRVSPDTSVADTVELVETCANSAMRRTDISENGHIQRQLSLYEFLFLHNLKLEGSVSPLRAEP